MPRSGSTLVEQILSSHPDVYGAGEVKYLSRALGQLRDRFPSLPKYPEMVGKITPAQLDIVAKNYQAGAEPGRGRCQEDHRQAADQLFLPRADQPAVPEGQGHPHPARPGRHLPVRLHQAVQGRHAAQLRPRRARPLLRQVSRADGILGEGAARRLHDHRSVRGRGRRHREGSEAPDRVPRPSVERRSASTSTSPTVR